MRNENLGSFNTGTEVFFSQSVDLQAVISPYSCNYEPNKKINYEKKYKI